MPPTRRSCIITAAVCVAVAGISWSARAIVPKVLDDNAWTRAAEASRAHQYTTVLSIIRQQRRSSVGAQTAPARWLQLEIDAAAQTRDIALLSALYRRHKTAVEANEEASLLTARMLLRMPQREADATALIALWESRTKRPADWFVLRADQLIAQGQRDAALRLLTSRVFEGPADASRWLRIAILVAADDPYKGWLALQRALRADMRNPDVRSFRAQVLEATGRLPHARVEYVTALLAEPSNPALRDQLAEFYRRRGAMDLAVQTWQDGLTEASADWLWVRALFWSRVVGPIPQILPVKQIPEGTLAPMARWLATLPADRFWDNESFHRLPASSSLARNQQEVLWLRLIQALQRGERTEALALLTASTHREQLWNRELARALTAVLSWQERADPVRVMGTLKGDSTPTPHRYLLDVISAAGSPQGIARLSSAERDLASGPDGPAAVFLAAGWYRTGLALQGGRKVPASAPEWFPWALVQATRQIEGLSAALRLADQMPDRPSIQLLRAEMQIASGSTEQATTQLERLQKTSSPVGLRAAWLLVQLHLEANRLDAAKQVLHQRTDLAQRAEGRALAARIALASGNTPEAARLFATLGDDSLEAEAFRLNQALRAGRKNDALASARKLLLLAPESLATREIVERLLEAGAR